VATILASMQKELLEKARKFRDDNTRRVESYVDFQKQLDADGGFFIAPWCQDKTCEAKVKEETKATIRCIPLGAEAVPGKCMVTGNPSKQRVVFARAY
jgi:prolyl-tRNA synthetase